MRLLAVDYGQKRTGLAICDEGEVVCTPLCVIEGGYGLIEKIAAFAAEYQAEGLVVGLPLNMDGTEGEAAEDVRAFAGELAERLKLKVYFQDERQSSIFAETIMRPAELTRKKKKRRLDAVAAAGILRAFIEHKTKRL